jgi:hypothetical protein
MEDYESKILHTLLWGFDFKEGMRGVLFISLGPCPSGEGLKPILVTGPLVSRYLVDPASNICLSQRLSHACLSINNFIL